MRSTFAASSENEPGVDIGRDDVARRVVDLIDGSGDQRGEVRGPALRSHDATLQPVEVEQVRQQALELASVGRDAADEVEGVGRGEVDAAALEGERRSEDRRQRCSEIVGDRLEERVLHLVEVAKALRRLPFAPEGLRVLLLARSQGLLGALAFGDVHHEAPELTRAMRAVHDVHDIAHPRRCARPGRRRGSRGNDRLHSRSPPGRPRWPPRGRRRRRGRPMSPLDRAIRSPPARASRRPALPGT